MADPGVSIKNLNLPKAQTNPPALESWYLITQMVFHSVEFKSQGHREVRRAFCESGGSLQTWVALLCKEMWWEHLVHMVTNTTSVPVLQKGNQGTERLSNLGSGITCRYSLSCSSSHLSFRMYFSHRKCFPLTCSYIPRISNSAVCIDASKIFVK